MQSKHSMIVLAWMGTLAAGAACAADRPVPEAQWLQLTFEQSAAECKAARQQWLDQHKGSGAEGTVSECFRVATALNSNTADRRQLPSFLFQVYSKKNPLPQPSAATNTLVFQALGPVQLAKNQRDANPVPPGSGPVEYYQMMVFSRPTEGQDATYNEWYDKQHVPEVMRNAGFISGQRFKLTNPTAAEKLQLSPYLVLFTLKSGDLSATGEEINARIRDGRTKMSPAFGSTGGTGIYVTPLD